MLREHRSREPADLLITLNVERILRIVQARLADGLQPTHPLHPEVTGPLFAHGRLTTEGAARLCAVRGVRWKLRWFFMDRGRASWHAPATCTCRSDPG